MKIIIAKTDIRTVIEKEEAKLARPGPNCILKNFANEENVVVNARKEIIKTIAEISNLK